MFVGNTGESCRLHVELVMLRGLGIDAAKLSPGARLASRFFLDGLIPLALLIGVSLVTRTPEREQVDQFFGKMKTPVAATLELDAQAIEATRQDPHRFDHHKIFPKSAWEWTRWNREDGVGFLVSCGVTLAIIGAFLGLLALV